MAYFFGPNVMNYSKILKVITQKLVPVYGQHDVAMNRAWQLLTGITGLSREKIIIQDNLELSVDQQKVLDSWLDDITINHKPLAYVLGCAPFLDFELIIRPPILIPRSDTECWVAQLITKLKDDYGADYPLRVLDLCTGSGCIAIAFARSFSQSVVDGIDCMDYAVVCAQKNQRRLDCPNVMFKQADLYEGAVLGVYDIIVANPPYIDKQDKEILELSVSEWEAPEALFADNQGYFLIEKIIKESYQYLSKNNKKTQVWLEVGINQAEKVKNIFQKNNFKVEFLYDDAGIKRAVGGIIQFQ
jgi:release factor glutamine methyltransferase